MGMFATMWDENAGQGGTGHRRIDTKPGETPVNPNPHSAGPRHCNLEIAETEKMLVK